MPFGRNVFCLARKDKLDFSYKAVSRAHLTLSEQEEPNQELEQQEELAQHQDRRQHVRFSVRWKARIMLSDRSIYQVLVVDVSKGGVAIHFDRVLSKATPVNIEFFANVSKDEKRIRAKTLVCHNTVLSNGDAKLGLRFTEVGKQDMHDFNNLLQQLSDKRG
jgi:c-di-GMP-binding flagellar brake protein YcgR